MDFDALFPHKYLLNLSRREDRRMRCAALFAEHGWNVQRHAAVDARRLKSTRGFETAGRCAHALGTRMILRRAAMAKAEAVFIFEDDVVFHPALEARLRELELPDDWGIFYLGCQHHELPEVIVPGLVRAKAPLDTHAWGVRAEYFEEVRRALTGKHWPPSHPVAASDLLLAELGRRIPAYAAYPNLAWQMEDVSDITGRCLSCYHEDGTQRYAGGSIRGLMAQSLGGKAHPPALADARSCQAWFWPEELRPPAVQANIHEAPDPPLAAGEKVAFLFLTCGPHLHPEVWEEYWHGHESRVSVYAHAKERDGLDGWLGAAQIADHLPTAWGHVSLVHAELALLKAALKEKANRFFAFASESCIPVRPFADLTRVLSIDGRSRFQTETVEEAGAKNPYKSARAALSGRIPPVEWRFHTQWVLLNREAAELLAANERLVDCFEGTVAPDESAFGTILHIAGYPLHEKVAPRDVTWMRWPDHFASNPDTIQYGTPRTMGDIAGSGCFFARKFAAGSTPGHFRLHVDTSQSPAG